MYVTMYDNRSNWTHLRSTFTIISLVCGSSTKSVAPSPLHACSMLDFQCVNHRLSKVTRAVASLLYVLTVRPNSLSWVMVRLSLNTFIGSSMRFSNWRDQWIAPATGGASRSRGGILLWATEKKTLIKMFVLDGDLKWALLAVSVTR